jgi:glycosyltransferase involved in cell wall biosynthesis
MAAASICVLMATCNGQLYLREQIDSIIDQTYENVRILVSDDGSRDSTRSILSEYQEKFPSKIVVVNGPRNGLESNFYSLIATARGFDLYAFADQDDVWDRNKLTRAVLCYSDFPIDAPFVYCGATILIDENSKFIKEERIRSSHNIGLRQALGHNIATGNTIVFNESTRALFPDELTNIDPLGHDWLTFIYALMFGGKIFYDDVPSVFYRIHTSNNSGIRLNYLGRLKLLWDWIFDGKLKRTNRQIIKSVRLISKGASPEAKAILDQFETMHYGKFLDRMLAYWKSGIVRKNKRTNWLNFVAVFCGKF